jgi:uncharacterized protein
LPKPEFENDFSKLKIQESFGYSILSVRVTPKGSRNEILGVADGVLRLKIHAPPVDGQANDQTREYLSQLLGRPRTSIVLERGQTNRSKTFRIEGLSATAIIAALAIHSR